MENLTLTNETISLILNTTIGCAVLAAIFAVSLERYGRAVINITDHLQEEHHD